MNLCDIPTQKISSNDRSNMLVHGNGSVHAVKGKFIVKLKNCNSSSTLVLHRFTWLWLFHASMQQHVPSFKDKRYGRFEAFIQLHLKIPHFFHQKGRRSNLKRARYVFRSRKNQKNKLASDSDFETRKILPARWLGTWHIGHYPAVQSGGPVKDP